MFKQICTSPQAGWPCSESFQPLVTSERHPCIHRSLRRASEKDLRLQCKVWNQKCFLNSFIHFKISATDRRAQFSHASGSQGGQHWDQFNLDIFFFWGDIFPFCIIPLHWILILRDDIHVFNSLGSLSWLLMSWQHQELGHQQLWYWPNYMYFLNIPFPAIEPMS